MNTMCHIVLGQFALFIMYCLFGTLFAGCAVVFVKCLAPYACGSGIPEVTWGILMFRQKIEPFNSRFIFCSKMADQCIIGY